jgi:hypothetical protein
MIARHLASSLARPLAHSLVGKKNESGRKTLYLTGTGVVGTTLTSSSAGQWFSNNAAVSGQTGNTYVVRFEDVGLDVRCEDSNTIRGTYAITTVGILGSSSVEQHQQLIGTTSRNLTSIGSYNWTMAALGQRAGLIYNAAKETHEAGLFGQTSDSINSVLLPQIIIAAPFACIVHIFNNDVATSVANATITARVKTCIDSLKAANILPIVVLANPRNDSGYASRVDSANAAVAAMCVTEKVLCYNPMPATSDSGTRFWKTNFSGDGVHPNSIGASVFGDDFAKWIIQRFSFPNDPFAAIRSNLKGYNPSFNGGSTLATGWNLTTESGTATASKVATGGSNWQQIVHAPANNNHFFTLAYPAAALPVDLKPRDIVRVWAEIECDAGNKAFNVQGNANFNGTGVTSTAFGGYATEIQDLAVIPQNGVYVSPYLQVPADATTVAFELKINGSGTYRVRDFGIEVVQSATAMTAGRKFYIDIAGDSTTGQPDFWNNHNLGANPLPASIQLRDTANSLTTSTLAITSAIAGGNTLGVNNNVTYPATAKRDFYFGADGATATMTWKISALDPSKTYRLTFFGSRDGVGDIRSARYTATGTATTSVDLNASNNSTNVGVITGIAPAPSGLINISITKAPSNNHGSGFYYINFMQIEVE